MVKSIVYQVFPSSIFGFSCFLGSGQIMGLLWFAPCVLLSDLIKILSFMMLHSVFYVVASPSSPLPVNGLGAFWSFVVSVYEDVVSYFPGLFTIEGFVCLWFGHVLAPSIVSSISSLWRLLTILIYDYGFQDLSLVVLQKFSKIKDYPFTKTIS